MQTGDAKTPFLGLNTFFKLVSNGAKGGSPRAATGFARNEECNAGRLAQIWPAVLRPCTAADTATTSRCRHDVAFDKPTTPGALNELERARNSIFSHPRDTETPAKATAEEAAIEEAISKLYCSLTCAVYLPFSVCGAPRLSLSLRRASSSSSFPTRAQQALWRSRAGSTERVDKVRRPCHVHPAPVCKPRYSTPITSFDSRPGISAGR
jgi:hypothetical protein